VSSELVNAELLATIFVCGEPVARSARFDLRMVHKRIAYLSFLSPILRAVSSLYYIRTTEKKKKHTKALMCVCIPPQGPLPLSHFKHTFVFEFIETNDLMPKRTLQTYNFV
jgi:hypothetical protein